MRRVINLIIILGLGCVPLGMYWRTSQQQQRASRIEAARQAVLTLTNQVLYHGSLGDGPVNGRGYPLEIRKQWFDPLPVNPLVDASVPWMAVADESERSLRHPRRLDAAADTSAFWYNPDLGVVRARVPRQHTEQATQQLYDQVNCPLDR